MHTENEESKISIFTILSLHRLKRIVENKTKNRFNSII